MRDKIKILGYNPYTGARWISKNSYITYACRFRESNDSPYTWLVARTHRLSKTGHWVYREHL